MAIRIVGVDLPQNKRGEIALTYVYGIGRSSSAKILDKAGVDKDLKVKDWTDDQAAKIREIIGAEYKVEGDLRSEIQLNITPQHPARIRDPPPKPRFPCVPLCPHFLSLLPGFPGFCCFSSNS